jgi:transposase-like protein
MFSTIMETTTAPNVESIAAGSNTPSTKRRRFTNSERIAMVRGVKMRVAVGESIRGACKSLNIIPKQYREWNATMKEISECRPQAMSICKGGRSLLDPIESDLLKFVFELREQGFAVFTSTIVGKASTLMREFREKSERAKEQVALRWLKRHSFAYRTCTGWEHMKDKGHQPMQYLQPIGSAE